MLFDYNDTVRDPGEAVFERESAATDLDEADVRRSSDHDPVVVGLDLSSLAVDDAVIVTRPRGGGIAGAVGDGRRRADIVPDGCNCWSRASKS